MGLMEKIFGDPNEKEVKKLEKIADQIEALDETMQALSDEELRAKTAEFKGRLAEGETLDEILPEAFAVVREAAWRVLHMKHFRVQLIGGIVLHQGNIAEMKTGEGKTLVATAPVYLNALEGKGVHVITVNDYLAQRDMEWMGKVYTFLGLTVGCVVHGITAAERKAAYQADITYGTNNEFGFDYLRDNMVVYKEGLNQRELNYAIVDEVDSILIDEARTPLIISGQGVKSTDLYQRANRFVKDFREGFDYTMDEKDRTVSLTENGVTKCEKHFGVENFSDPENMELNHHVIQALKANTLMKRDVDYIVKDGEIVIVDEFTGRLMYGRRYSEGLHQAIEAKEGIEVRNESMTLATITVQNYFRMYSKLAGMTGTAKTEEDEFHDIYNMNVVTIPTNRPVARVDLEDSVYSTERGKFTAIAREVEARHATGQPILVGTISIDRSEILSNLLKRKGIKHNVLNAKQHAREAEIIAEAGRLGSVTIATNMAGRGTDIILGGNPDFEAKKELKKRGYDEKAISYAASGMPLEDPELLKARREYEEFYQAFKAERAEEQEQVRALGGLHIIGSERHESRRIDNQLRGRAGRQGDPGSTQFFISLEDELMRLFGGEWIQNMMGRIGVAEDVPLEAGMLSRTIENAQKKVEARNFSTRKYVLQYDDVMNKQRALIYEERRRVLDGEDLKDHIFGMVEEIVDDAIGRTVAESKYPEEWDLAMLAENCRRYYGGFGSFTYTQEEIEGLTEERLREDILDRFSCEYGKKEKLIGEERMRELERMVLLQVVDRKWMDHIDAMDQLKHGIGLRAIGQQDPAKAYSEEGFDMFEAMVGDIKDDIVRFCFNVTIQTDTRRREMVRIGESRKDEYSGSDNISMGDAESSGSFGGGARPVEAPRPPKREPVRVEKKPGRNDPCPCGSGKKYKNCCGKVSSED